MKFFQLLIIVLFIGCINNQKQKETNLYSTPANDSEMNKAIATARSTLLIFDSAYKSNKYDTSTFSLKVRFPTQTGAEHIWATSITLDDNDYYGLVDNLPELVTEIKEGQKIKINRDDISDWLYSDNGILRGGYTIRLIRNRMTKEERKQFDDQFQLFIQD
jgi:uncharacterized protein YegJ (DUF2314 family)